MITWYPGSRFEADVFIERAGVAEDITGGTFTARVLSSGGAILISSSNVTILDLVTAKIRVRFLSSATGNVPSGTAHLSVLRTDGGDPIEYRLPVRIDPKAI